MIVVVVHDGLARQPTDDLGNKATEVHITPTTETLQLVQVIVQSACPAHRGHLAYLNRGIRGREIRP